MKIYILRPEKSELFLGEHVEQVAHNGDILEVRNSRYELVVAGVVTARRWVYGEPQSGMEDCVFISIRDFDESDNAFRDLKD